MPVEDLNHITFAGGFPVSSQVTIDRDDLNTVDFLAVGTQDQPIDLDAFAIEMTVDASPFTSVYDADVDHSSSQWGILRVANDQRFTKGAFDLRFTPNQFVDVDLHGGSTDDDFEIGEISDTAAVKIFGEGGADIVNVSNANGHLGDLDAAFPVGGRGFFRFIGGPGLDILNLNDSADQTGDGDQDYSLTDGFFSKGPSGNFHTLQFDCDAVLLTADADNNTIAFSTTPGHVFNMDGGPGNDTYKLDDATELENCGGSAFLAGGAGTDSFAVADDNPAFQSLRTYTFTTGGMTYADAQG